jgi:hypothetical protein
MRQARRLGLTAALAAVTVAFSALPATSQGVTGPADDGTSLSVALDHFSKKTGVGVVFADRLVEDLTTFCKRIETQATLALECILEDTGLHAVWSRPDQVVLSANPPAQVLLHLSGRVFDVETREPMPGAHVVLINRHDGVVTDEHGKYQIEGVAPGRVRLVVSHLGYESQDVSYLAGEHGNEIFLEPQAIEGAAVVVEDSRSTHDDELSASTVLLSEGTDGYFAGMGESTFALGSPVAPGISRTGEISGQFVVRGGSPDQNVFKLEGAPVYQPWHSQGLFSILQPSMTNGIDLYTGPLPVDQGGYLASVLDAELSAGGQTTSTMASISSTVGEVAVSTPLSSNVTAMVAGRRSHPGLNRTYALSLPNNQELDGGSFYDVAAKVGVRPNINNQFFFTAYRSHDDLDWNIGLDAGDAERTDQWSNGVYAAKHRYISGDRLMVSNSFYVSSFDALTARGLDRDQPGDTDDSQHIRDAGMKIDVDYLLAEKHSLKTGAEFLQHHLEWTDRKGTDYYRDEVMEGAVFAHDTWRVTDKLFVRPGLRVSWFGNGVGVRPEPRFHAMYSVSSSTAVHASWSRQVQYLHQVNDIVSGGLGSTIQRWMVASDNTTMPSTGQQANLGVTAKAGARWNVSADIYWRDFENVFLPRDQVTTAFPLKVTTINETGGFGDFEQGSTKAYGVEMAADYRNKWFVFSSSYTGSRSLFRVQSQLASGSYRPGLYDTPHVVRSTAGYVGTHVSVMVSGEARTGYPTMASILGTAHQIGNDRMPTYFRLDASLGYQFKRMGLDWNIQGRLYNLTDRANVVGYEYDRELLYLRRTSLLGVGRWPTFNIQVSW